MVGVVKFGVVDLEDEHAGGLFHSSSIQCDDELSKRRKALL